ncbi:Uncharacterized conserved protein YeaO, DUF488 family [Alicyclobacillus tolerans]|uniref:Uncharacterized conserved protein YeaO, DUF488 family n=1 Tax=Alicyclobacillus tolerans TaxID=90970 RepID=A0A1M6JUF2_9BACL|nr:Uncharacterized conserved protein YeaO, DUF488 family [Alicyclobacillus montanus]
MKHENLYLKRIYIPTDPSDGTRILIDRLWPRGIRKEEAYVDIWLKEIAPTDKLRKWFHENPEQRFSEFRILYNQELTTSLSHQEALNKIKKWVTESPVTLVYGAKNELINHAVVLYDFLLDYL